MKTKLNLLLALTLLLNLVFSGLPQPVSAQASAVGTYIFTSSSNPSAAYQEVTFSLSATGTDANYQPFGYVAFKDNGTPISGCDSVFLNFNGSMPIPDSPAVCRTRLETLGEHAITADFTSMIPDLYADASLTLDEGQTVTERLPVTFDPETLPDGTYGTYYGINDNEKITATCGGGGTCGTFWWWITEETLPPGMEFEAHNPAAIMGAPEAAGEFTFSVTAEDSGPSGARGSHTYTWNVLKATPKVTIEERPASAGMIYLLTVFRHPDSSYPLGSPQPTGTVSFSVDDMPLDGCSGENAIPVDSVWGYAYCYTPAPAGLEPGSHTVRAEFTPDTTSAANYNSASGTWTLNIFTSITGLLFEDLNQNGVRDEDEEVVVNHQVNLDHGCNSSVETWVHSNDQGLFVFESVTPDENYCLSVESNGSWRVTTALEPFTAIGGEYFEIGLHYVELAIKPESLPNGSVGEPYYQTIFISGGTEPYTVNAGAMLPEGMTFDQETLTVSGTPVEAGVGGIILYVQDEEGITGRWELYFLIQTDGVFTLTSDANPSAPDQEVTFTLIGSVSPDYDLFPPFGSVAFYDGEDPIVGCEVVPLNDDPEYGIIDQPAVCRTSALGQGSHEIRAVFTSSYGVYRDASRTLTQIVQFVASADLSIDKTDSKDPVKPGAKLVYALTVRNSGPDAAQNLTLVDTLDRTTTYVSTSAPKGWTCTFATSKVTCTSAGLASGSTAIIKITVTVNKDAKVGKELVNNASVSSETSDPDLLNNSVVLKTLVIK